MPYDLQPLVLRAVDRYADPDGEWDGMFNSACFAAEVKAEFDLPRMPDGRWVADVLRGLWYVDHATPGVEDAHWVYGLPTRPEKVRQAEEALESEPVELPGRLKDPMRLLDGRGDRP